MEVELCCFWRHQMDCIVTSVTLALSSAIMDNQESSNVLLTLTMICSHQTPEACRRCQSLAIISPLVSTAHIAPQCCSGNLLGRLIQASNCKAKQLQKQQGNIQTSLLTALSIAKDCLQDAGHNPAFQLLRTLKTPCPCRWLVHILVPCAGLNTEPFGLVAAGRVSGTSLRRQHLQTLTYCDAVILHARGRHQPMTNMATVSPHSAAKPCRSKTCLMLCLETPWHLKGCCH